MANKKQYTKVLNRHKSVAYYTFYFNTWDLLYGDYPYEVDEATMATIKEELLKFGFFWHLGLSG